MNTKKTDLELLGQLTKSEGATGAIDSGGPPPLADAQAFTAEWCTQALTAGGALNGATVTAVSESSLGPDTPGFLGLLCRLHLTYDTPGAGPATMIAKRNSPEEFNRAIASGLGFYEREYRVYRELAATLPVRTAVHFYSALDADRFVLLMQDLGEARVGRQSQATDVADLEAVLDEVASLHAHFAGAGSTEIPDWVPSVDRNGAVMDAALQTRWPGFVDNFTSQLRPAAIDAAECLLGRVHEVLAHCAAGPVTLIHGDFRIDNVLFDVPPEPDRPLIIDWQAVGRGQGVFDVAQIVALSLEPDTRRAVERDLLERYAARIEKLTGTAVSRDDQYEAYRIALLFPFTMGIAQTDMDTDQVGSDTSVWLQRASEAVADHGIPVWLQR